MKLVIVAAGLGLAACSAGSNGTNASNGAAPANVAAPAPQAAGNQAAPASAPADLAGARTMIERIYGAYASGNGPEASGLFTPELQASIARHSEMEGGGLSYDPFCQCQDFEDLSYRIEALERSGADGALARVAVTNMGETRTVTLRLANRGGRWLIADVNEALLEGR